MALFEWGVAQTKNLVMSGFVTDKESHPLEGARVTVAGDKATSDTTTDSEGAFILTFVRGIQGGSTVRVRIEKPGYKPYDKLVAVSAEIPLRVSLESAGKKKPKKATVVTPTYDRAHLAVVRVDLWAAPMHSEAMVTVRNIGSKPVVPCAILRGAIITSPWLNGSEPEDRLFLQRPEWQEGGKGQVNCQADWNPGVDKTYSIQRAVPDNGLDDWTSLMLGEKLWYVVSRLEYRDSDMGSALPPIETCVYFRAEKPEWTINKCYGHNDPTRNSEWLSGSGREGTPPPKAQGRTK